MKAILSFVLASTLFTLNTYAQEIFGKSNLELNYIGNLETMSVVDNEESVHLFFISEQDITHAKYNSEGNLEFQKKYPKPFYPKIQGSSVNDDNSVHLFLSNNNNTKFFHLTIPEGIDAKVKNRSFEIKSKHEKFICSINNENHFYIFTYIKKASIIKKYNVLEDTNTSYDFSKERFYDRDNKPVALSEIFNSRNVAIIDNSVPNSIDITSEKIKLYITEQNDFMFTLNHRKTATRTIQINSKTDETNVGFYNMPVRLFKTNEVLKSNSFFHENRIYQFICSKERINLSAFRIGEKKAFKEYNFNKNDDLSIKNETIKQKGGTYAFGGERDLEKTSQFLRKISKSQDVGINVFQKDNRLNISIGGKVTINHGSTMNGGFGYSAAAGSLIIGAYASYNTSRSVFINCLFNPETFEHLEGDLDKNIFDRISEHSAFLKESNQVKKLKLESVFKYKDNYLQGYYDKSKEVYSLIKYKI